MPLPVRKYKDLNLSLTTHPMTDDLVYLSDEEAVKRSIKNIVLTNFYEKYFDSQFGCGVAQLLFEPISMFTKTSIQKSIANAIQRYEPRADLKDVDVTLDIDNNGYSATITFMIVNQIQPITVDIFLERKR